MWVLMVLAGISATAVCFIASACSAMGDLPEGDRLSMLKASANFKDGKFHNSLPVKEVSGFKAMKEWLKGAEHTEPESPVPVMKRSKKDFAEHPMSGLRITWLGHSTSIVEIDGARFLLDPVWSKRSSPVPWMGPKRFFEEPIDIDDLPRVDAVIISHDHYDHLDKNTVKQLAQKDVRFVVPLGVDARLVSFGIESERIDVLDWWQHTRVADVNVTATPARHFSGRSMSDRDKTLWAGFALTGERHRVYYTGDTGMFPGFREIGERLGPFDATLVEIGAYNRLWADLHLGPEQAVQAVLDARGGLMIPVHWAKFNLAMHSWIEPAERVIVAAEKKSVPLAVPKPGQSIEPASPLPVERWWPQLPWQTAEEHPIVSSGL